MRFRVLSVVLVTAAAVCTLTACTAADSGGDARVSVAIERDPSGNDVVRVGPVPAAWLARASGLSVEEWQRTFQLRVGPVDATPAAADALPAVAGRYGTRDDMVVFTPMYPLEPGLPYIASFDPAALTGDDDAPAAPVRWTIALPAQFRTPATRVARVFPSTSSVPENQLRLYVHFSAPMGRQGGPSFVRLLDDRGEEVRDPFLPLEADFWNGDRTRYTLFFDPGRVKRGILPNEEMGRSLVRGRQYTLIVSRDWRDAHGQPLVEEFRHTFTVEPPDEQPLSPPAAWRIHPPRAGTREPLRVDFPEPLDHGLLQRALGVVGENGQGMPGETAVAHGERAWSFTPAAAWTPGPYQLKVLSILEDVAGNRIGQAFEVDRFEQVDRAGEAEAEATLLSFRVP